MKFPWQAKLNRDLTLFDKLFLWNVRHENMFSSKQIKQKDEPLLETVATGIVCIVACVLVFVIGILVTK